MSILIYSLVMSAVKSAFENAAPKADVDAVHHKTKVKVKIDGERVRYAYHHSVGKSNNVVWFWHGFGSDEEAWYSPGTFSTKKWLALQGSKGYPVGLMQDDPHVFCISFDRKWMISDDEERRRGEKDAVVKYVKYIIDSLEAEFLPNGVGRRLNIGVSMGGHNALMMYLHHPELWDGTILHNPLLKDYVWAAANPDEKLPCDLLINSEFKRDTFDDVSPNAAKGLGLIDPAKHGSIQIHTSMYDEFGFHPPALLYSANLASKGVEASFVVNAGGHHDLGEIAAAAYVNDILSPLPEPVEETKDDTPEE